MWPTCCWPRGLRSQRLNAKKKGGKSGEKLVDAVMVSGFGRGGTQSNTPIFVHIRTSRDVWTGCALLCNSGAKSWQMRRDGLKPVQPHYPKISRPYSRGSKHWFDGPLLKIFSKANWFPGYPHGPFSKCRMLASTSPPRLEGWMGDCSGVLMTTPSGLINSAWLLEHQVKDNQVVKLRPGLTVLTLPQLRLRTSRAHSWVPQKQADWMVLETLLLLLPRAPFNAAQISDTVFFTWYVHLCLPKPLETLLKFAFHPFFFPPFFSNFKKTPRLNISIILTSVFSPSPHAHFLIPPYPLPPLQGFHANVSVTADHQSGGSAGHFRAPRGSRLTQRPPHTPPPLPIFVRGLRWCLVPGRAERHLAKPQKHFQLQTAWCSPQRETRPKVEELIRSYHITVRTYSPLIAVRSSFCFILTGTSENFPSALYMRCDSIGADVQKGI